MPAFGQISPTQLSRLVGIPDCPLILDVRTDDDVAAILRARGFRADVLEGGHLAWAEAGLLALSVGLSRLHRDDPDRLEAGIALYDALYRWARDGYEEGHDWPQPGPRQ